MKISGTSKQPSKRGGLTQSQKLSYALNTFGGLGLSREQTYGLMGGLAGESGRNLDTKAYNPNDPNGGSIGIGQWHSDRRKALEAFAAKSKYGIDDYRTQIDFVAHELKGTHSNVLDSMLGATTRQQASKIWTQKYEVPKKAYEFLDKRAKNADYFAQLGAAGPADPQAAVDAAGVQDLDYTSGISLTGATLSEADDTAAAATAYAESGRKKSNAESMFDDIFGGVGDGLSATAGLLAGKSSQQVAAETEARNSGAAQAAPDAAGGFFGDTSMGAIMGSIAGGMLGGPMGAILGGLAGQGIDRALTRIGDDVQTKSNKREEDGLLGGVGRSVDSFLGGLFGAGKQSDPVDSMGVNDFPDAPKSSGGGKSGKGYSYSDLSDAGKDMYNNSGSQQLRDAVDSGKPGAW